MQLALDHITGLCGWYTWLAVYRWIAEVSCSFFVYPPPPFHPRRRKKSALRLQLLILFGWPYIRTWLSPYSWCEWASQLFIPAHRTFSLYYRVFVRLCRGHTVSGRGECYDALFGSSLIFLIVCFISA